VQQAQAHLSAQHFLSLALTFLQQLVLLALPQHCVAALSVLAGVGSANAVKANALMTAKVRMDFIDLEFLQPELTGLHQ